ncbi:folylpolyglutamate synthase, mitochondrial-like isoform X2 [Hyalella azteca]|uniref:tetrahydrofolate synthase n=1 Tax=Hyalella azteca TaxID=294128 RepID=A0A979FIE4_HYAAZ|nr:folylpolyglutamate synthase, mitochondrial-like isoform X2 [Hyalella azteca]
MVSYSKIVLTSAEWQWASACYCQLTSRKVLPSLVVNLAVPSRLQKRSFAIMVAQGYEEAITALNGLQSNAATIPNVRMQSDLSHFQLPETIKYMQRAGVTIDDLDQLSVIHVTGTKGKGSTCAFTEQILRQHGYKTGLYTSPHLVSVTERIRINGRPIHRDDFTKHFWNVYNSLYCKQEGQKDMPAYFKFMTVLALKVFLEENIDVAVLEVGIGGEYDCTNVVRKPVACGITSLDLDHTSLLGNTLASIAWHKGGIIKPGAGVYTTAGQDPQAFNVLLQRAAEKQCKLLVCPALDDYSSWTGAPIHLGLAGQVQRNNASLALQLARHWISKHDVGNHVRSSSDDHVSEPLGLDVEGRVAPAFPLTYEETRALQEVVWPGRSQVLELEGKLTFFLDGAHTSQSMAACAQWFSEASEQRRVKQRQSRCMKVLWFNATGDRDVQKLLQKLLEEDFAVAIFSTNMASQDPKFVDQINRTVSGRSVLLRCQTNSETWQFLLSSRISRQCSKNISAETKYEPSVVCKEENHMDCINVRKINDVDHFPLRDVTDCRHGELGHENCGVQDSGMNASSREGTREFQKKHSSEKYSLLDKGRTNVKTEKEPSIIHENRNSTLESCSDSDCVNILSSTFVENKQSDQARKRETVLQENIFSTKGMKLLATQISNKHVKSCLKDENSTETINASLDRTHMLQLIGADDSENSSRAVVIPYIQDALHWLINSSLGLNNNQNDSENRARDDHVSHEVDPVREALAEADQIHVLVTGSLHLVGGVLAILDPSLADSQSQKLKAPMHRHKMACYSSPGAP